MPYIVHCRAWVFTLLLAAPVLAASTQPSSRPSTQPIESLLAQLSSDNAAQRQHAQDQLVQLGVLAQPALERLVQQSTDEEALARARAALRLINENRLTGPTLVTLH